MTLPQTKLPETTLGYYKQMQYKHDPNEEKQLFTHSLTDYLSNKDKIIGVEIGVLNGETSAFFLNLSEKILLIGIDPLIPDSMEASLIGSEKRIMDITAPNADRFTFIKDYSYNAINKFTDGTLDFIFIDGSHHYEDVKKDYELYLPKVKKGGLVYFHDSRMYRGGANFHEGSSRFVEEVINNDKRIELIGEAFSLTAFIKD